MRLTGSAPSNRECVSEPSRSRPPRAGSRENGRRFAAQTSKPCGFRRFEPSPDNITIIVTQISTVSRVVHPQRLIEPLGTPWIKMLGGNEFRLREVSGFAANFTARTGAEQLIEPLGTPWIKMLGANTRAPTYSSPEHIQPSCALPQAAKPNTVRNCSAQIRRSAPNLTAANRESAN